MLKSDIRILEIEPYFSEEKARVLFKFGNTVMDTVTLCHVRARVENRSGQTADGWGAIFLSHIWAYRTPDLDLPAKDRVMRRMVENCCKRLSEHKDFGHPIDIFVEFEKDLATINESLRHEMGLGEVMPYLGALVCASPLDAALHDAFGKVNGMSTYDGYSAEFMTHDLSHHLGSDFAGRYPSDYISPQYAPTVPVFHTVGGLDKLRESELTPEEREDVYPNSLEGWIKRDGVYCFKIKLHGQDFDTDMQRLRDVYHIAREIHTSQKVIITSDTNEQCESPDYMVEMLHKLKETDPETYDAMLYVEQPTERDLEAHRFDMRPIAKIKPIVIDESLTGLDTLDLALELGWSGVGLKTCKCQSIELLILARARQENIHVTVQDLTNPGIALLHSVGFTARINPMMGLEANSRQYYPHLSEPEATVHPDIVRVKNGVARTDTLKGSGLGYQIDQIPREIFK